MRILNERVRGSQPTAGNSFSPDVVSTVNEFLEVYSRYDSDLERITIRIGDL